MVGNTGETDGDHVGHTCETALTESRVSRCFSSSRLDCTTPSERTLLDSILIHGSAGAESNMLGPSVQRTITCHFLKHSHFSNSSSIHCPLHLLNCVFALRPLHPPWNQYV